MRRIAVIISSLLLFSLVLSACSGLPASLTSLLSDGETEADSAATQRALSDEAAKAAAQETHAEEKDVTETPAEAAPLDASEATATATPQPTEWLPTSPSVGLFGGGVLYFCHGIEIQQYRQPTEELARALAYPEHGDLDSVGLVTVAATEFPALQGTVTDLDRLANEVSKQEDLCQPATYAELWDSAVLSDFTPTDDTYLTGIASLVEDTAEPYWVIRIGIVEEGSAS